MAAQNDVDVQVALQGTLQAQLQAILQVFTAVEGRVGADMDAQMEGRMLELQALMEGQMQGLQAQMEGGGHPTLTTQSPGVNPRLRWLDGNTSVTFPHTRINTGPLGDGTGPCELSAAPLALVPTETTYAIEFRVVFQHGNKGNSHFYANAWLFIAPIHAFDGTDPAHLRDDIVRENRQNLKAVHVFHKSFASYIEDAEHSVTLSWNGDTMSSETHHVFLLTESRYVSGENNGTNRQNAYVLQSTQHLMQDP